MVIIAFILGMFSALWGVALGMRIKDKPEKAGKPKEAPKGQISQEVLREWMYGGE